jgi:hypothetical protein
VALPEPVPGLSFATAIFGTENISKDVRKVKRIAPARSSPPSALMKMATSACWSCPSPQPARSCQPRRRNSTTKQRLQLDDARSWMVLSEWNEFVWPGPDLRRLPNADDSSVAYGMLPPRLFATIRDRFMALVNARASGHVSRTCVTS